MRNKMGLLILLLALTLTCSLLLLPVITGKNKAEANFILTRILMLCTFRVGESVDTAHIKVVLGLTVIPEQYGLQVLVPIIDRLIHTPVLTTH